MIKIAYIIDSIETPGAGTENQLLGLLHRIDRRRFDAHLLCLRPSDWLAEQSFPFPTATFRIRRMKSPAFLADVARLARYLARERYDIVQTFFVDGNVYGTLAARLARTPHVVSSRRNIGYWHDRIQVSMLRILRRWTDRYLANSQAVVERTVAVEGVARERIQLIYNGADLEHIAAPSPGAREAVRAEWGVAPDEVLIGAVANLRAVKNVTMLTRVAAELAHDRADVRLVLVGEGPERGACEAIIEDAGQRGRMHLAGARSDVAACLAAFDIAVLPSASESFSNALIEYMAAGKPIVASRVGGNVEAIDDGRTGLLFDPTDPAALRRLLARLLDDPGRASRLGTAAQEQAMAAYGWETSVRAHEAYYAALCGRTGARG